MAYGSFEGLYPFQQYFSHSEPIKGTPFMVAKYSFPASPRLARQKQK